MNDYPIICSADERLSYHLFCSWTLILSSVLPMNAYPIICSAHERLS